MGRRIAILQGHPDCERTHLGHALAAAYEAGARDAGHEVRRIEVARLDFPFLRSADDWKGPLAEGLRSAQATITWAEHILIIFPLWTGTMPALLKAFLEQIVRPEFAFRRRTDRPGLEPALSGRTAHVVVTMGMPSLYFRWTHHSYGVRSLQRGVLGLCGIKPVGATYIGQVDAPAFKAEPWLAKLRVLGAQAG